MCIALAVLVGSPVLASSGSARRDIIFRTSPPTTTSTVSSFRAESAGPRWPRPLMCTR